MWRGGNVAKKTKGVTPVLLEPPTITMVVEYGVRVAGTVTKTTKGKGK